MIEVFADVSCPFTHVGLRRFVERRRELGRTDLRFRVYAWPLELVNGTPLDPGHIGEEVDELRARVAPDLFAHFEQKRFPRSSLPALVLAAAAYDRDLDTGERVSLALRDALFEQGRDVGAPEVVSDIAAAVGLDAPSPGEQQPVLDDWEEGKRRGVMGSPHFFVGGDDFFCPALDIKRVDGHLQIAFDPVGFNAFLSRCLES